MRYSVMTVFVCLVAAFAPSQAAAQECEGCSYTPFATCQETSSQLGYDPCYEVFLYCSGGEYCEQQATLGLTQDGSLLRPELNALTLTAGATDHLLSGFSSRDEIVRRECDGAIVQRRFTPRTASKLRQASAALTF